MKSTLSLRCHMLALLVVASLLAHQPGLLPMPILHAEQRSASDTVAASPTTQAPVLQEPRRGTDAEGGFVCATDHAGGAEDPGSPAPLHLCTSAPLHPSTPAPLPSPSPLALSKRAEPASVQPGDVLTYTVAVTHTGQVPLRSVVLSDTLPAGLVYVEGSAQGFAYLPAEHRLVWALPELAAGQALEGGFQARVTGYALGQAITNTVEAAGGDLAQPVTATVTTRVGSIVVVK